MKTKNKKKNYIELPVKPMVEPKGRVNGQLFQDLFVNKVLDIDNGFFVDLGAGTDGQKNAPIYLFSNTSLLEDCRQWDGIAIDYDKEYIDLAHKQRKCTCVCADLTTTNINDILQEHRCPPSVDYLSFDVDNAQEHVLNELDFSKYKFKIITYEHNLYQGDIKHHEMSRQKFIEAGYKILCGNVVLKNFGAVEDWYVHSEIFDEYKHLQCENISCVDIITNINKANTQILDLL